MKRGNILEKKTLSAMIRLYCRSVHRFEKLCPQCAKLEIYALKRIDYCIYGPGKPSCKNCPVHCYNTFMSEEIKKVMRVAGPRMLLRHPILAVAHLIRERKKDVRNTTTVGAARLYPTSVISHRREAPHPQTLKNRVHHNNPYLFS